MSILAGKLALFTLAPVVGAGVVYPLATKLGGGEGQISFLQIKDFETNCWVSLQGESGDEDGFNKKLLACRVAENSKNARFYFYEKTSESNTLPKAVKEVIKRAGGEHEPAEFALTLSGQETSIKAVNKTWDGVFGKGINVGCIIEITKQDGEDGTIRKLSCNNSDSQRLEAFKVT